VIPIVAPLAIILCFILLLVLILLGTFTGPDQREAVRALLGSFADLIRALGDLLRRR